ncbi:hypothetical protein J7L67_03735 [bacterium]|nr:hypothetical protein [bacterium]
MKTLKLLLTVIMVTMLSGAAYAADKAKPDADQLHTQTNCPVMSGKINPKYYADVNGKRIYVCCPGCIAAVKKDPSKYIEAMEAKGIVLENAPEK